MRNRSLDFAVGGVGRLFQDASRNVISVELALTPPMGGGAAATLGEGKRNAHRQIASIFDKFILLLKFLSTIILSVEHSSGGDRKNRAVRSPASQRDLSHN